jgi:hypothetical protein
MGWIVPSREPPITHNKKFVKLRDQLSAKLHTQACLLCAIVAMWTHVGTAKEIVFKGEASSCYG